MNNRFKIILVRDPRFAIGGAETWVETLSSGLLTLGHDVVIFVPSNSETEFHEISRRLGLADVRRIPACEDNASQAMHLLSGMNKLIRAGERGIYFTMLYEYINIVGLNLLFSPFLPIPVLHGRHSSAFDWMCSGPPKAVVVPSDDFAQICRNEFIKRIGRLRTMGRVVTIPHGVQLPSSSCIADRRNRFNSPIRLVASSRLSADIKRPLDYIHIADTLKQKKFNFIMRIVGDGPLLSTMKQMVIERKLIDNVEFIGAVPHDEVYNYLSWGDIFLSTSESEAFGLSIAEAMACGCVPITTNLPGAVQDLVVSGAGYKAPIGDISAFCDFIETLACDKERRDAYSTSGMALIKQKYSSEIMVMRYAKLVKKLQRHCIEDPKWQMPQLLARTPGEWARRFGGNKVLRYFRELHT